MLTGLSRGLRRRTSLTALFFAFLSIAALMIAPAVLSTTSSSTKTTPNARKTDATSQMSAAMSSLHSGQGPLGIGPMSCSAGGSGSAYCSGQIGTPALASGVGAWTSLYPTQGGAPIAYDVADGYVILFGGTPSTWKFLGGSWTNIPSVISPSSRTGASMAYDAVDGYVILFGGLGRNYNSQFHDTWKFLGGSWTNITSTS